MLETPSGLPFNEAPLPRSAVNSSCRVRIEDGRDLRDTVDLERERRAEDRQAMDVVRRAVKRIEHPAWSLRDAGTAAQFFGEHLVIGKAFGDELPEHAFDGHVDFGHEIDRALLVDAHVVLAEVRHLQRAGLDDDFDGGGEKTGVERH